MVSCETLIDVLLENDNKCNQPISYIFRTLTEREQKYRPIKREALALVWSL